MCSQDFKCAGRTMLSAQFDELGSFGFGVAREREREHARKKDETEKIV